jgi:hypothetical protein
MWWAFCIQNFMNLNSKFLPVIILAASIILGCFYYAGQISKEKLLNEKQLKLKSCFEEAERLCTIASPCYKSKVDVCYKLYK